MFRLGDIDPNSIYRCTDSFKETLRQKMLNQEVVFRMQLFELHRLYRTQMNLMEECKPMDLESCYVKIKSTSSTSYNLIDQAMYSGLMKDTPFTTSRGAISMQPMREDLLEKQYQIHYNSWFRCPDFKQRPLDLQLPADEFISHINDDYFHGNETRRNPFEAPYKLKTNSLIVDKVSDFKDPKFSLGIRDGTIKKSEHGKNKCRAIPHDVIDLEDPSFSLPSKNRHSTFSSGLASSSFTPCAQRHLGHEFTGCRYTADIGPSCFRQASISSGFCRQQTEQKPSTDFSNKKTLSLSRKAIDLDLNMPLLQEVDTSPSFSDNSTVLNPVNGPSSSKSVSVQAQAVDHPVNGSKLEIIDLELPPPSGHGPELKNESAGSVQVNLEKTADNNNNNNVVSSDDSSIRTMQSGIDCGDSHVEESRSPLGDGCIDEKEEEAVVDEFVQAAAETILCISSSEIMAAMADDDHQVQDNEENRGENSSDSYELLVLKRTESGPEDYEVSSSKATVVAAGELEEKKKKRGSPSSPSPSPSPSPLPSPSPYKLKRGTRMRDFQKDILPALSSLLRHEICEDVSIMENAIRSREYKKMKSKMGNANNDGTWCTSVRSRRSRTNYRRRYYA
ncbi:hypothetical protein Dimus_008907 [Dionaea muscipula]